METSRGSGSKRAGGKLLSMGLLALLTFNVKAEEAQRVPASMGSLGDSMTAGALAAFKRHHFIFPWEQIKILVKLVQIGATRDTEKAEARHLSWAGGYDKHRRVYSHSYRLSAIGGHKGQIPTANVAVSGAESIDVFEQLERLNQWSERRNDQPYPDYVTMMIGPNDICAESARDMVSTVDYHANVAKVVDEILSQSPNSKVMVGALPNIENLRRVAAGANLHVGLKCEALWKTVKLCPTLTTISDSHSRQMIGQRVVEYNEALRDIVESRRQSHGDRVRLASKTYDIGFNSKDLSIDCFHPNEDGQAKLAEVTFSQSWWAKDWGPVKAEIERKAAEEKKRRCNRARRGRGARGRRIPGC